MEQAYRDAQTIMAGDQHKVLIDSERQWLHFVNATCPLGAVGGIPPVTARSCVGVAFQTRIGQLRTCLLKEPQEQLPCLNDFHLSERK